MIRVFAVRSVGSLGPTISSCGQRRLWSDWADVQVDPSLRWAHMPFCWFCHEAALMKAKTTKAESQEDSSFQEHGHQAVLKKANKRRKTRTMTINIHKNRHTALERSITNYWGRVLKLALQARNTRPRFCCGLKTDIHCTWGTASSHQKPDIKLNRCLFH